VYDGVKLNPTAFRELERIFTDRLDFQPSIINLVTAENLGRICWSKLENHYKVTHKI